MQLVCSGYMWNGKGWVSESLAPQSAGAPRAAQKLGLHRGEILLVKPEVPWYLVAVQAVMAGRLFEFAAKNINWFPGHMASARLKIEERVRLVDMIFEVRDARIPHASACAHLNHVAQRKRRIIIFNKSDLITAKETRKWSEYWAKQGQEVMYINALKGDSVAQLSPLGLSKRGLLKISDRVLLFMIIGVPNTGKSTVINALRGVGRSNASKRNKVRSNVAGTGARPGVTRQVSTIQISFQPPAYLVDTPGMLSPRLQNDIGGYKLALTGAVKDAVVDPVALADYLLYKLNEKEELAYVKQFGLAGKTDDVHELLNAVCRRVGIFRRTGRKDAEGGEKRQGSAPDHFNAAMHLIQLYRKGSLGRFVLDSFDGKSI